MATARSKETPTCPFPTQPCSPAARPAPTVPPRYGYTQPAYRCTPPPDPMFDDFVRAQFPVPKAAARSTIYRALQRNAEHTRADPGHRHTPLASAYAGRSRRCTGTEWDGAFRHLSKRTLMPRPG